MWASSLQERGETIDLTDGQLHRGITRAAVLDREWPAKADVDDFDVLKNRLQGM